MAPSGVDRPGLVRPTRCRRSRTTSDFEHLRPRDSASISATSGSGNRTVIVFMEGVYYNGGSSARQVGDKPLRQGSNHLLTAVCAAHTDTAQAAADKFGVTRAYAGCGVRLLRLDYLATPFDFARGFGVRLAYLA